ncbi:MAG: CDP-alcohol phosphatidyltransferase family protein [Candidatus Marinimicrobia bacterium]|nr:CDP-alcohol phosphatidyltransferase family protein [Candidatus Neomarinimicrobiota bacterium]
MKYFVDFLTYSRIILTPLIIYLIYINNSIAAALVFAYCSFSDVADGRLARKHNLVSEKGNYLDPLADKILMIGTLSILAYQGIILLWAYGIIIGRDILITMYRNYLIGKKKPLVTSQYGKWKTVFQHVMIIVILLNNPTQEIINLIVSFNAIYAAATGAEYVIKNGF